MNETAVHPCAKCGGPLAVRLGGVQTPCARCGHVQTLDAKVDRDLRHHGHAVEATLELAEMERAKLEGSSATPSDEARPSAGAGLAGLLALGGLSMTLYYGSCQKNGERALYAIGVMVAGYALLGLITGLARLVTHRRPEAPVGTVECRSCGGVLPIQITDLSITCTYCHSEVMVSEKARKRAMAQAERELAFARAQMEAQRLDRDR